VAVVFLINIRAKAPIMKNIKIPGKLFFWFGFLFS
jgi:hypothetical protein